MITFDEIFLFLLTCKLVAGYEFLFSSVSGEVERNNFAYYSMSYDGTVLLKLVSISGDCDVYVSQFTKKPSYEPESNCLSSITCGVDTVIIPKSFKRPVGIGIFGHPSHDDCSYNLAFYKIDDSHDIFNFNSFKDVFHTEINNKINEPSKDSNPSDNGKNSFFWDFLKSFLEFMIEVIL